MASYKSHYNAPRRSEEQTLYPQRAPSTRLPQRSVTPTSTIASSIPVSGHSKLQKKKYARNEPVPVNKGPKDHRAPASKSPGTSQVRQGGTALIVPLSRPSPNMPVPKGTRQITSSRLPKPESLGNTRTPSLASGSSASTSDSPRSNLLRRKPSKIGIGNGKQLSRGRAGSMSSQEDVQSFRGIPGGYKDPFSETVLGISLPPTSVSLAHSELELDPLDTSYQDYDGPLGLSPDALPPPNPAYALSSTPSTRYSESPGPFSVSSTPTSMSSYSPGVVMTSKAPRVRQTSPLESRPPVARNRSNETVSIRHQHGLSSVRESSTSSSSTSTILAEGTRSKDRTSPARRLPPPPASPPTRSSSLSPSQAETIPQSRNRDYLSPPLSNTPRFQTPPELAHLADQPPKSTSSRRPSRPSRDGTSEITGLREPSPVIQSNMTSFPSYHRRTSSSESKAGVMPNSRSRFGLPSKASSRNPSPNPSLASGFAPVSRVPTRGTTPDLAVDTSSSRTKTVPSPSPSPAKHSRFGFFSRKTKTEAASAPKQDKKLQRKGPAAGTGHEGYGRYALRGRSSSTISGGSIGKSASAGTTTESLNRPSSTRKSSMASTGSSDMDDFFLERLNPVVIRGTGSSTELSRSPEPLHGGSSLELSRTISEDAKSFTSFVHPPAVLEKTKPVLLPSAMSDPVRSPVKKQALTIRRPSESDEDTKRSFLPSLTSRRASRTSKIIEPKSGRKAPTNTGAVDKTRKASIGGPNSRESDDYISEGKEGKWLKPKKAQAPTAKPVRKWNFFQRALATAKTEAPVVEVPQKPATSRSVAHYALMDPQQTIDLEALEQIIQDADSTSEETLTPEETKSESGSRPQEQERLHSMLLPPRPVLPPDFVAPIRPASPKVSLRPEVETRNKLTLAVGSPTGTHFPAPPSLPDLTPVTDLSPASSPCRPLSPAGPTFVSQTTPVPTPPSVPVVSSLSPPGPPPTGPPPRPSRLAQVGRIPQVVSRRGQERRPSSQSFSRPFVADQPRPPIPARTSVGSNCSLPTTAGPVESHAVIQGLDVVHQASSTAPPMSSADESLDQNGIFTVPARKNSEVSYSSSSGVWSFPATSGTAIIPDPAAPQSDDEIWNEYDDLIDEVLSPGPTSKVLFDNDGKQLSGVDDNTLSDPKKHPSLVPLRLNTQPSQNSISEASNPSIHLRRSRLLAVLHSAQTPTSPLSLSEFFTGYGERNISVVDPVTGRLSLPSSSRMSSGSGPQIRPGSVRSSLPASLSLSARQSKATVASDAEKDRESTIANRYRDTRLMEIAETQADGLVSMANLRFGALMTSKWLSFGRVLFSPVHFELKNPNEDRVLVIDGLGKDWSYYCALTYPEATIYNLGPGSSTSSTTTNATSEPWSTLRNHRHISHQSLASPLPFPRGFFACAVLRFPPALPSSVHRSILSECKRVLRPGGYLELSVLDLDLVNMGNRARRAIRGLKVKLQVADEQVSLRNISDEIMAGLGRKGFTECNRCFVGVPVAGKLPNAEETDASEGKTKKDDSSSSNNGAKVASGSKTPKAEISFSDLLTGQSSGDSSTDEGITDMVARVGRWWYSRCYESLVLPDAGEHGAVKTGNLLENSIWKDENLLRECENRGTSFRLLIGYAQKPEVGVRRTVSV